MLLERRKAPYPSCTMTNDKHIKPRIPRSPRSFRFSRTIVGLLLATAALAVVLVWSTWRNIDREQTLMEKFLRDKGETIIRSIEAGSRTTMMHHMGGGNPLHTLLQEYSKDKDIQYIEVISATEQSDDVIGTGSALPLTDAEIRQILTKNSLVTKLDREQGLFRLFKLFKAREAPPRRHMHSKHINRMSPGQEGEMILSVGLLTRQFDLARQQDVRHAIFMGAILFLVGSTGLYFLFLYQRVRVTSSNLADMKLYTDSVIESIPVCIITLDADDHVVSCNHNTEELFNVDFSQLQAKKVQDVLPTCSTTFTSDCDQLLERETECKTSDNRTIPLRISCSPLQNTDGQQIGKVLILRDMSVIKEMELQLERSRRMAALGKMAAGIAHEIRNPLGTLRGFAQYFGSRSQAGDNSKKYSELMISEIDRLNQTISGLLQFSRPREPQFGEINITDLFSKTVSMMEADLISNNIEIDCPQESDLTIQADPDLLLQVLMNLLKNSINALPEGGKISLRGHRDNHQVILTIADNGYGMSEEIRQRMFDPFFTTLKEGTGLGLAVSHQIVEQHGGSFEVKTAPEQGTSITIALPQKDEKEKP